jgi:hypothetical protein
MTWLAFIILTFTQTIPTTSVTLGGDTIYTTYMACRLDVERQAAVLRQDLVSVQALCVPANKETRP